MTTIARYLEVLALGTWVGSILYLSFVVAPAVFSTLASRDQAGTIVGLVLGRLHLLGYVAGVVFLIAAAVEARSLRGLARPAAAAVVLMLALTSVSQQRISPRMARLRTEMVSVDRTPRENPSRVEFDRLHRISVRLESSVLILGLVALFLTVRHRPL
jgi:uncharacterized membrane protein